MEDLSRYFENREVSAKLVGRARSFVKAIECLPAVARSDAAALITGETGTGKEMVVRTIHYLSARANYPMIAVNCGSLPDTLLEEELFGHERGAFTGAHATRRGLIREADRGTLFLDEVDTMPPKAQVALLRVVQEKSFRSVGSNVEHPVDVRVIAATNECLEKLVTIGLFRKDLYYRLCIFSIHLPPLRSRTEDIEELARHFLEKHRPAEKVSLSFSACAVASLLAHNWPGNIRELENAVIRGIHLSEDGLIRASDLFPRPQAAATPESGLEMESFKDAKHRVVDSFERSYLTQLMTEHHGNVSQAAQTAGKERRDLGKLLKKHGMDRRQFRRTA
jgi:two-component system, NtrC family, response regulator GlrR